MKFEHTEVFNFEGALRGLRNPKNSWAKSDSHYDEKGNYIIGENDMRLAKTLIAGGSEHRKFLRQIFVSVDITAPLYWFSEFDTYKVGTVANSTSTMHTIMSKPFTPDLFQCDGMRGYKVSVPQTANEIDEDTEEWKVYPLDPMYYVSNQGRVKHLTYVNSNGRTVKEKILSGSLHQDGYVFMCLVCDEHKYKLVPKHVMVAQTWIPNPNNKPEVNHLDGNKLNNCAANLEWATSSENQNHAIRNNLQPKPVSTYKGKLSKEQREEIILRYSTEEISRRQLAKEYGVTHATICAIINNKYNYGEGYCNEYEAFLQTLDLLNELRDEWLITKDKQVWKTLIELLPRNWLQTRTVTMNYENLLTICKQRKHHKLNEWSGLDDPTKENFIGWASTLPYAREFIFPDEAETQ